MFSIFQKFYAQSFKIVCQNWLYFNMPHSSLPLYFMYFLFIPSSIFLRRNCNSHNSPFFSFLKIFKYLCSLCKQFDDIYRFNIFTFKEKDLEFFKISLIFHHNRFVFTFPCYCSIEFFYQILKMKKKKFLITF